MSELNPAPKKIGRPKKIPGDPVHRRPPPELEEVIIKPKRETRGRPRKYPLVEKIKPLAETRGRPRNYPIGEEPQKEPGHRGRPKKVEGAPVHRRKVILDDEPKTPVAKPKVAVNNNYSAAAGYSEEAPEEDVSEEDDNMAGASSVNQLGPITQQPNENSKYRPNPAYSWCFTYNNPDLKFIDIVTNLYKITDFVFQLEKGSSGTLHFQGVCRFDSKSRPRSVFGPAWNCIHWEVCRDWDASVRYCQKIDTRVKGPWFKGNRVYRIQELKILKEEHLYSWQKRLLAIILEEPDDRKIYWVWEPVGKTGKTTFCKFLSARYQAILLTGKAGDMKYAIAQLPTFPRVVLIDCPRGMMDYISYSGIEEVKNGYFFCGKYESKQIIGNPPHLIVFANCPPDMSKLSADRWEIIDISSSSETGGTQ